MSTNTSDLAAEFGEFLTSLYGLDIEVSTSDSGTVESPGAVATYVDEEGAVQAQIICDLSAAVMLGAALSQIPAGGASDCIAAGEMSENISDNLHEVLNIVVNVFASHASSRVVLRDVLTGDEAKQAAVPEDGTLMPISIPRYGDGKMLVACAS